MDRNTGLKLTWFQVPLFQKQTTSGAVLASPPHILDILGHSNKYGTVYFKVERPFFSFFQLQAWIFFSEVMA